MSDTSQLIIGVDLGGTNTKVGLVKKGEGIIADHSIPTEAEQGPMHVIQQIATGIRQLLEKTGKQITDCVGIGIGAPGQIELDRSTVRHPPNFPKWGVVNLGGEIQKIFGVRTVVDNDANAAAVGEAKFGAGIEHKDFVLYTLGTGIGGGIIIGGEIFRGSTGGAGELGHLSIDYNGPKCLCGNYGCVEAYIGQRHLSRRTVEKLREHPESKIHELIGGDMSRVEPYIISVAANQGDAFALSVWKEYGMYLGVAIISVLNTLDMRIVIIGGAVAGAGKPLFDAITETVKARALEPMKTDIQIIPAKLGNQAGTLGAAALVL
jgi:glucokinase